MLGFAVLTIVNWFTVLDSVTGFGVLDTVTGFAVLDSVFADGVLDTVFALAVLTQCDWFCWCNTVSLFVVAGSARISEGWVAFGRVMLTSRPWRLQRLAACLISTVNTASCVAVVTQ